MKVDLNLYNKRVPIVYTTRLEDMTILKEELIKKNFEDTIKTIIDESKPCYKNTRSPSISSKISKPKHMYFKKLKLKRKDNIYTKIEQEILFHNTDTNKDRSRTLSTHSSKNPSNNQRNESNLKTLLALCRPLRIVVKDIRNEIPKRVHEENKVIYISSSDDEDSNSQPENEKSFYTIRNTEEYKDFINKKDLRNSVVVFYNQFLDELDAYEIDDTCIVVDCLNAKSSRIYKFQTKKRNSVFNIVVCCWKKRQYYVSLLSAVEKYCKIANFMYTRHSCQLSCACCCFKENTNCNDNIFTFSKTHFERKTNILLNDTQKSNILHSSRNQASDLISNALVYKKHSKWKGNQDKRTSTWCTKTINDVECTSMLKLSNPDGMTEIYELGRGDQIFSKLVTNSKNDSSWLLKTQSTPQKIISPAFHGPMVRESQIYQIKKSMNISVANYLRIPKPYDSTICNKRNLPINRGIIDIFSYNFEYTMCLAGAKNKRRPVIPILPKEYITGISEDNQQIDQDLLSAPVRNATKILTPDQVDNQIGQNLVPIDDKNKDVSQCINSLIKNILHRFRDINLTINSEGKVSASLNAPLSSLSPSELKILSGILVRAQSQVDELGLINRNLNEDTKKLLQSNYPKSQPNIVQKKYLLNPLPTNITNDTNKGRKRKASDSPKFDNTNTMKTDGPYTNASSEDISNFSTWVSEKKIWYGQTFQSFMSDAIEHTPLKIVDVFSLQTDVGPDSRSILKIPEDMEEHENNDTEITDIKTEIADELTETRNKCLNEIQQQMCLLDN